MGTILHMLKKGAWEAAEKAGIYRPESLESEGFIHCSTAEQLLFAANGHYKGEQDMVLLCIDEAKVQPEIIYEDCYETGLDFPHIYGPLETAAVVKVLDFPTNPDGTFSLPPGV